jgi:hypothetical protein
MFKAPNKYLALFLIVIFSFIYRMVLMHWQTFPPGADIGLHNSVIHSITASGNTNFLWNDYQMGGGISLTFPGYHIFVSYIMLMTGLPEYLVHSLVVSLFSSFIVLCAFLITRTVWKESAALIVAFLVAISRFDIEMLMWGGYPNVITLMLMPLTFYLLLQKQRFSIGPFLATTTLLSAAIFLTHSLNAAIFVSMTFATVILVTIFSKKIGVPRTHLLIWLVPLFLGMIIVSPFLLKIVPAYLSASGDIVTGSMSAIQRALLSTRVLPLELVLPLLVLFPLFFLFSKKHNNKFFTVPAFLLVMWILIPTVLTQSFLVGLYIDYNRFLYFVVLPVIILIAIAIDHGSSFFSRVIDTYRSLTKVNSPPKSGGNKIISRLMSHVTSKSLYSIFVLFCLLFSFLAVPIFLTPWRGTEISEFYQAMSEPGYEAIRWIRQQTPVGSVLVSDAYYGWWLSGFAQRPTFSAVPPQYLTLTREFEPAKIATRLLDTDYMVDNGLIQVREDGGYIGRHNPIFLVKLNWTYFPYSFLNFNNSKTIIQYRVGDNPQFVYLDQLLVKEMRLENETAHATIVIKKGNDFFNYTQLTTVTKGSLFVNMTVTLESAVPSVTLDCIHYFVDSKGYVIQQRDNTIGIIDEGVKAFAQLIFDKNQPEVPSLLESNPLIFDLFYNLQGKSKADLALSVTAYSVSDDLSLYQDQAAKEHYFDQLITGNLNSHGNQISNSTIECFDYQAELKSNQISYIISRYSELTMKMACDPAFNLVFINDEVAVFMVKRNFN